MPSRKRRAWIVALSVIGGLFALAAIGLTVLGEINGPEIWIERVSEHEAPLVLDVPTTRADLPVLARALDEAASAGASRITWTRDVGTVTVYLDERAQEQGSPSFLAPPQRGHVQWANDVLRIGSVVR